MNEGWQTKKLGDVCDYDRRFASGKSLPYLGMEQIESGTGRIIGELAPADTESSSFEFSPEHVLYGRLRPYLNKVAMPQVRGRCSTEIFPLRPAASVSRKYLFYWLIRSETVTNIGRTSTGARMPRANMNAVANLLFSYPPLAEQKRIVAILDESFEQIAKATANSERNLANARDLIAGSCHALISNVAPDAERISLEKLLERGWILSHLDGNHGSEYPRKEEFVADGIPYISANAIDDDAVNMGAAKYLAPERAARIRKGVAQDGDVLFAHNATVGPVAVLETSEPKVILGTSLTYYRCNAEKIDNRYLAHYMRSRLFTSQYDQIMRQSTRNQVPITKQREFFHIIPKLEAQREISSRLDALEEWSRNLRRVYAEKTSRCFELRQALLHKAFSGQLTGKEAVAA